MRDIKYFLVLLLLPAITACTQPSQVQSPPGYDLTKPEIYTMPSVLNEISGITFKSGNADTIYAEQDEEGKLFYLRPGDETASHFKFAKRGDYEDVAIYNGIVIILRSDGALLTFLLNDGGKDETVNIKEYKDLLPGGEYESMYADEKSNTLYVLCKECSGDKKEKKVSGYTFKIDPAGQLTAGNNFSISEKDVEKTTGINKINLKASAMGKNILTGEWYILSAVNRLLLVTDDAFKVKNAYPLAPASLFKQPEGIAFDSTGNLYIANENAGTGPGTILKFSCQKK